MIGGIEVKVCGLTRASDAAKAAEIGADFLGFIFYPKSPRALTTEAFQELSRDLPDLPKVAVTVLPDEAQLRALRDLGFNHFQIHFPMAEMDESVINEWAAQLTPESLWLAPKVDPAVGFDESLVGKAETWHLDTFHKDAFGGTGAIGDWGGFREISRRYPEKTWTLAGGLNAGNLAEALGQTGAKRIDLSSGLEESPGIKDPRKLEQVRKVLESR